MPSVVVEVRRSYSRAQESALIQAVHQALVEAFRIPPRDPRKLGHSRRPGGL
jgi:phenylpyruvate tautomerase PptA (4-oxalocrotonate tautomerase family)